MAATLIPGFITTLTGTVTVSPTQAFETAPMVVVIWPRENLVKRLKTKAKGRMIVRRERIDLGLV